MHTKNLENSSKIESFMGQNAQAHKLNLMCVYMYTVNCPKWALAVLSGPVLENHLLCELILIFLCTDIFT